MQKSTPSILLIAIATIAFALISVAVFLTFGKNKKVINWKVKIGAWLITLTTVVNTGCPPTVTCYDPYVPYNETNVLEAFNNETGYYEINLQEDSAFSFKITYPDIDTLEYRLSQKDTLFASGMAEFIKESENQDTIWFDVPISTNLKEGFYDLELVDSLENADYLKLYNNFPLKIINATEE